MIKENFEIKCLECGQVTILRSNVMDEMENHTSNKDSIEVYLGQDAVFVKCKCKNDWGRYY